MTKKSKQPIPPEPEHPPLCGYCTKQAVCVSATEIYPNRPDLSQKWFWLCRPCKSYVGCAGNSKEPLGTLANRELRNARMILHNDMLDPLWKNAHLSCGDVYKPEDDKAMAKIHHRARQRVYRYLANKMGVSRDVCHTAMFDLEECREAWKILANVQYVDIRSWSKPIEEAERAAKAQQPKEQNNGR